MQYQRTVYNILMSVMICSHKFVNLRKFQNPVVSEYQIWEIDKIDYLLFSQLVCITKLRYILNLPLLNLDKVGIIVGQAVISNCRPYGYTSKQCGKHNA